MVIRHCRNAHINTPQFPLSGLNMRNTFFLVSKCGLITAKMATTAAKRLSKSKVAVFTQDFFFGKTGYFFSLLIEIEYAAIGVVSNNPFLEIIQNPLKIMDIRNDFFQHQGGVILRWGDFRSQGYVYGEQLSKLSRLIHPSEAGAMAW
jgi:hypothetical protein